MLSDHFEQALGHRLRGLSTIVHLLEGDTSGPFAARAIEHPQLVNYHVRIIRRPATEVRYGQPGVGPVGHARLLYSLVGHRVTACR